MHNSNYNTLKPYLKEVAEELGPKLASTYGLINRQTDPDESYARPYIEYVGDGQLLPNISVDYNSHSKKLSFRALLPLDRWGYAQRAGWGTASMIEIFADPYKNAPKTVAACLAKMIEAYKPDHLKHLEAIKRLEDYYDRQMAHAKMLNELLPDGEKLAMHGVDEKPNHNGDVAVRGSIETPSGEHLTVETYGGGHTIKLSGLSNYKMAEIIHVMMKR